MTKLICEVTRTEKGKYYNFYVVLKDGTRVQVKPRFENQILDLYEHAEKIEKEVKN